MRAVLIDATARTVEWIEMEPFNDVRAVYGLLEVRTVEVVTLPNGDSILVDGEGLLKPNPGPFFQYVGAQPIPGKGLVVHFTARGRSLRPRHHLKELRRLVTFPAIELAGFDTSVGPDEILGFPAVAVTTRALFKPKGEDNG